MCMLSCEASTVGHCQRQAVRVDGLLDWTGGGWHAQVLKTNICTSYLNLCKKLMQCYVGDLIA